MKPQITSADYKRLSDEELAYRYIYRQDRVAINFLFERYSHLVLGIAFKFFKNGTSAKKATQAIFISLLEGLPGNQVERFKPWLLKLTHDYCVREVPGKKELNVYLNTETDVDWQIKTDEINWQEKLESAASKLNKEQRTCIDLFYQQKLTYQEISKRTGSSYHEVKNTLRNAAINLKTILED